MAEYYSLYIFSVLLNAVNSFYLYKKYQLTAGTSLWANTIYLIINGIVSAVFPAVLLVIRGEYLQFSAYSFLAASAIVICAALGIILHMKAYSMGKIATVSILSTMGHIILSCAWGILMLHESLSFSDGIAIGIMLLSTFLVSSEQRNSGKKGTFRFYLTVLTMVLLNSIVSILSKQHQVETRFTTVDTLSFSIWVAVIRTVLFSVVALSLFLRHGKPAVSLPKPVYGYATASSLIAGGCYIITLFTSIVLPIVITSPLSTGLNILLCSLLPWIFYRERLSKKQIAGVIFSFIGVILFLVG